MWCGNCHQDVPSVAHATSGRLVCSRCQQPAANRHAQAAPICDEGLELTEHSAVRTSATPPIRSDDWEARKRARELDRALRRPHIVSPAAPNVAFSASRLDPPQLPPLSFESQEPATRPGVIAARSTNAILPARNTSAAQVAAWFVVTMGTITLGAGLGLIGWSLYAEQMQHWNLSLSLAIGGQGTLILGLVMVVTRLWRNSRYATNKLQEMHAKLGQLQNTADTISGMRSAGAPSFYADLARGASPQMMLSNLKGQLDQLATRVGG